MACFWAPIAGASLASTICSPRYDSHYFAGWMLDNAIRYQDFFQITVAFMKLTDSFPAPPNTCTEHNIQWHKTRAISLLRQRLSQPGAIADDGAILTVLCLSAFETAGGNPEVAILHQRQVEKMIAVRGIRRDKNATCINAYMDMSLQRIPAYRQPPSKIFYFCHGQQPSSGT